MKNLFLVAIIAMFSLTINAQEFKFGAKAGLNLASISGDPENVDMRTSFHVGGIVELEFTEKFSLQSEVVFSNQGAKTEEEYVDFNIETKSESTLKLSYINVPVLAKYYVIKGLSLEAGPQVSFLIDAEEDFDTTSTINGVSQTESMTVDVKDDVKTIDFGLGFGMTYELDFGLNFGARYNLGLTNINDTDNADNWELKNNVLQFSVGYFF